MSNESGVSKLRSSQSAYQSAASSAQMLPGMVEADKGFELKSGLNGGSSGPALNIYQGPGDGASLGMPKSDVGPSDDNDSDESKIVEPDKGFTKEPVAGGR